jgi:hypothetical protein
MSTSGKKKRSSSSSLGLIAIVIGAVLALLASIFGALWLSILRGIPLPFNSLFLTHPSLQIHGFLTLFIIGAAYIIIPRFKNKEIGNSGLAYLSIAAIAVANIIGLMGGGHPGSFVSEIMLVLGSALFAVSILPVLGRPSGSLWLAEPYMHLGVISLILISAAKLLGDIVPIEMSPLPLGFLELSLLGFPAMMIFGVSIRTIHFRPVALNLGLIKLAIPLAAAAILTSFLSVLSVNLNLLATVSLLLFAGSLLILLFATRMLDQGNPAIIARMVPRDRIRCLYFSRALSIAAVWLLIGVGLGVAYGIMPWLGMETSVYLRDSFIHAIAVGFIGTAIMAYGPILLPSILSGRTPYVGLSLAPVYLVSFANAWRVMGNMLHWYFGVGYWGTGFVGIPLLLGLGLFLVMIHSLK